MFSDRSFKFALVISLITHGAILFKPPSLNFLSKLKPLNNIEITYLELKLQEIIKTKGEIPKREIELKANHKDYMKSSSPPPFREKEKIFKESYSQLSRKPILAKTDIIEIKKKIKLKSLEINKITSPTYISYYQIIREKIRRSAYQNYTRSETGQVYLTFVILSDGTLKEVKAVQEKSTVNNYLKEVALKSIKDVSPYPAFPKGLEYPQLSFNVIISFQID